MMEVQTMDELWERLSKLTREDSVCQVLIPGIGTFVIVLQEVNDHYDIALLDEEKELPTMSASELSRNPYLID
ncbi:hypothetical protein [Paenibacillus lignilyticus]|uniref:Uncharacterized protein n=1 Tax=Paenibacillus lignilyticus TaxID=1172615 RepID=A0ABS5CAJ3_9BACL|nr:hypothetical protein [Paenibacillus lignilyticus]MBP3962991.1 hypothetical protein [Paenibacillus lignilyticus]